MKSGIYNILKARFLLQEGATKHWFFLFYVMILSIMIIANANNYDKKIYQIAKLSNKVKELRSEFVDKRSELMKLKLESTIVEKMVERNVFPSQVPPKKIRVKKTEEKGFFKKLWQ